MKNKTVYYPFLYQHFKNNFYVTLGISKPIDEVTFNHLSKRVVRYATRNVIHTEKPTGVPMLVDLLTGEMFYVGTKEHKPLVVYTNYNSFFRDIFARPIDMFLSNVDKKKYPQVRQKERFKSAGFVYFDYKDEGGK